MGEDQISRGRRRAREFTWRNCARDTLLAYQAAEKDTEKEMKSGGSSPKVSISESQRKMNREINRRHPEFELTYDMMLGIRTTVGR